LKAGSEVFTIPNTYISSHTVSFNADGTTEETLEFATYVTPSIRTTEQTGATSATDL
jgi:hypothetical protein